MRSALLFTPFFALSVLGFVYIALGTETAAGRITGLVLVGLVMLLLGYQVTQSLRDLFSGLVETVGPVERRWSRNEFFLFRNTYIFVDKNVYRLSPEQALEIDLGNMVRITHLPNTGTVQAIEVVRPEANVKAG